MARTQSTREKRLAQVRAWLASGLSAREFGARRGIPAATLSWWRWRLRQDGEDLVRRPERLEQFVEILPAALVASSSPASSRIELHLGRLAIHLPNDFDEVALRRVLGVVEDRP